MRAPRTIRARLTLLFLLIVAAAVGGLYLYVVPTLQQRLTQDKLDALRQSAARYGPSVAGSVTHNRPALAVAAEVRGAASLDGLAGGPAARRARRRRAAHRARDGLERPAPARRPALWDRPGRREHRPHGDRHRVGLDRPVGPGRPAVSRERADRLGRRRLPAAGRRAAQRQRRAAADPRRRRARARVRRARRVPGGAGSCRAACGASSTRPRRSPPATSRARSRSTPTTSWAT